MIEFKKNNFRKYRIILNFTNLKDKTGVFIAKKSKIALNTLIGDGTRINGKAVIKGSGKCEIKKYCAIGDNLRVITSNHKTNIINLQYGLQSKIGLKVQHDDKKNVTIGNNVWIGDSVLILPGVEIGNGAIIAAGSVVTKNVPAYSLSGGVPSKVIKYRFGVEKIEEIEQTKWWDWSLEEMKRNSSFFSEVF